MHICDTLTVSAKKAPTLNFFHKNQQKIIEDPFKNFYVGYSTLVGQHRWNHSVSLPTDPLVYLPISLLVSLSICWSVSLLVYPSVCQLVTKISQDRIIRFFRLAKPDFWKKILAAQIWTKWTKMGSETRVFATFSSLVS